MDLSFSSLESALTYAPMTITAITQCGDAQIAVCLKRDKSVMIFNVKMMEQVGMVNVDYMDGNVVALDCPKLEST